METAAAISIGIGALGFLPLLIVLWKIKRRKDLVKKGDFVVGTVLDVTEHRGPKGSTYYRALIEYPVFNQAPIQRIFSFSGKKGLEIFYRGRRIDIYYDKEKPERFVPREAGKNAAGLVFTIIVALGYIVICYCLYGTMKGAGI